MVRVFKGLENKKKAYYAVTDTGDICEAIREVAKHTKGSYTKLKDVAGWMHGTIAPYENGMDGLWVLRDKVQGEPCIIVYK